MRTDPVQMWRALGPASRAMASLTGFSTVGGVSAAMVTGDAAVGFATYYVLAVAGLCAPEGAPLRRGLATIRRRPRSYTPLVLSEVGRTHSPATEQASPLASS